MKTLLNLSIAFSLCGVIVQDALGQANYLTPYTVTTIAGTPGVSGSADGTNGAASFYIDAVNICGVAADTNGNVYVTDTGNSTIRKLTPIGTNWVVSTIAGMAGVTEAAMEQIPPPPLIIRTALRWTPTGIFMSWMH